LSTAEAETVVRAMRLLKDIFTAPAPTAPVGADSAVAAHRS